ncbi:hypothetical protein NOJ05_19695 [Neorhizobium galegae]|uniref:hypothetical protein n=1 Tax=Neorhizobium galegae TaxID=399 RepID=UPI002107123A|nr:hypothetical protein [Neorhizobium galegae]MCQ1779436.1 hypothetical protein [Neorhizobium galegae]MCQ1795596.1 hypothetical protein [Neorhizobium galegae]
MNARDNPEISLQPTPLPPSSPFYASRGVTQDDWEEAEFLQRLIHAAERYGKLPDRGLPATPDSEARLVYATEFAQKALAKHAGTKGVNYHRNHTAPTVEAFNLAVARYRKCGNHPLALIPEDRWLSPIPGWDGHMLAVTATLGVELPHPQARRDQESLRLAVKFYESLQFTLGPKSAKLYRAYEKFIATANNYLPANLHHTTFERRVIEQLAAWFPALSTGVSDIPASSR